MENNITRRGILGAVAAVPIFSALGASAAAPVLASPRAWKAAMARYDAARATLDGACEANDEAYARYYAARQDLPKEPNGVEIRKGDTIQAAYDRAKAAQTVAKQADADCRVACALTASDKLLSDASDADDDALQALFATPAPDLRAAIYKADLVDRGASDGLHHVLADLRRLAAEGR